MALIKPRLLLLFVVVVVATDQTDQCGQLQTVAGNVAVRFPFSSNTRFYYLWYRTLEANTVTNITLKSREGSEALTYHFNPITTSNTQHFSRIKMHRLKKINVLKLTGGDIKGWANAENSTLLEVVEVESNKPVEWINCTSSRVIAINRTPTPESSPPWTHGYCTVGVVTEGVLLAVLVVLESVVIYHLYYRRKGPWVKALHIPRQNTDRPNTEVRAEENTDEKINSYARLSELFQGRNTTDRPYQNQAHGTTDHTYQNQAHGTMDHTYQNQAHGTMDHTCQNQAHGTTDHTHQNQAHGTMEYTYQNQDHGTMDNTYQNHAHGTTDNTYQNQAYGTTDHTYHNQAHDAPDYTYEE